MTADAYPNQALRLDALYRYKILDTPREPAYDEIVFLATQICGCPFAVINFVDESRQWFKAEIGLGVQQAPRDTSIHSQAIFEDEFLLIPDTLLDKRFAGNPLCALDPRFRFYAGALLKTPDGHPLGGVCVLDTQPRSLTETQQDSLKSLARQVMNLLELRLALNDARESEVLAREVMENNPDCVKVLDLEGRVLTMNQNGCRLMEVDHFQSVANRRWPDFWQEPEREKAVAALQAARKGNQARFSGFCKTAKGKDKYWDVVVSPIMDPDGQPHRILSIARDMTMRRIEEARLRETTRLESLGVLAGGIAHDFNNLLTGVLGNARLLEMTMKLGDRALTGEIIAAAEQGADLTRQMLAYSGKGRVLVERLNLSNVVTNILRLIQSAIGREVELILSLDKTLPAVEADLGLMQQLIMNLVINASEAMQGAAGKIVISTAALDIDATFIGQTFRSDEPSLTVGRYVRLEVHDTGAGMSEDVLARIFDPFFSTKFTGRGLGLAAVSGILRAHRGAMRVYSHVGLGTTFKVFLPAAAEVPRPSAAADSNTDATNRRGWGTVLMADDEESFRLVARASLQKVGYEVLLAEDGRQALELFKEHRETIRLVILDLTMPFMNGAESLAALRKEDPQIPILLSSGFNQVEMVRRFEPHRIAGFIQKPFTARQLNTAVAMALDNAAKSSSQA